MLPSPGLFCLPQPADFSLWCTAEHGAIWQYVIGYNNTVDSLQGHSLETEKCRTAPSCSCALNSYQYLPLGESQLSVEPWKGSLQTSSPSMEEQREEQVLSKETMAVPNTSTRLMFVFHCTPFVCWSLIFLSQLLVSSWTR